MADVDEYEETGQLLALQNVTIDHCFQLLHRLFTTVSIAVAWKIDDVPAVIDEEVIDKLCLSGSGRGLGQLAVAAKHIDKR